MTARVARVLALQYCIYIQKNNLQQELEISIDIIMQFYVIIQNCDKLYLNYDKSSVGTQLLEPCNGLGRRKKSLPPFFISDVAHFGGTNGTGGAVGGYPPLHGGEIAAAQGEVGVSAFPQDGVG